MPMGGKTDNIDSMVIIDGINEMKYRQHRVKLFVSTIVKRPAMTELSASPGPLLQKNITTAVCWCRTVFVARVHCTEETDIVSLSACLDLDKKINK